MDEASCTLVEVWTAQPGSQAAMALVERCAPWLGDDDRCRLQRLQHARDRALYELARALSRHALSRRTGLPMSCWVLAHDAQGRPVVRAPAAHLHLSVAHTDGLVACALAVAGPVGVDVERLRTLDDLPAMAEIVLTSVERQALQAVPAAARSQRLLTAWVLKEACAKALGRNLGDVLHALAVQWLGPGQPSLRVVDQASLSPGAWWTRVQGTASGHLLAIATSLHDGVAVEVAWHALEATEADARARSRAQ